MTLKFSIKTKIVAGALALSALSGTAQAEPFIGEIRAFGENFCPRSWSEADGKLLAISQNTALFSIIGTTFGGDGRTTMALPNLRGRFATHAGRGPGLPDQRLGQRSGATTTTLTTANMPSHNHLVTATNAQGNKFGPGGDLLGDPNNDETNSDARIYADGSLTPNRVMNPAMISNTGGGQPLSIQAPFLAMKWCIALFGVYPSRN
jgi:microcystin-dependent protein